MAGTLARLAELPNLLSLARLPLGALLWVHPGSVAWLLGLMALAALSDVLDGWLARRRMATHPPPHGGASQPAAGPPADAFGAVLDPICDKAFVASLLALAVVTRHPPAWAVAAVAVRDVLVTGLFAAHRLVPAFRRRPALYRARPLGKATTAAQFGAVAALLFDPALFAPLAALSGALGVLAFADYLRHSPMPRTEAPGGTPR